MRLTYGNAICKALYDELEKDDNVVVFGEDIQSNLYGYTEGLSDKFGSNRIINIPLSEAGIMGMVCGAAMCGLRPVLDLTLPNFLYVAMDQIASIAAKTRYMYNGVYSLPMTIFCSSMCGSGNAAQHSDRLHSLFMTIPGLKVICPATPQDMYSLLRAAIEDNNPVICFADRTLFWQEDEVLLEKKVSIGSANRIFKGDDLTIVTVSSCLAMVKEIIPVMEKKGISIELIDVRTVVPLDYKTIQKSVKKTGKILICDTANRTGSLASEIASLIVQHDFYSLKEPIKIVACEDIPIPFASNLEKEILVTKDKILKAINSMCQIEERDNICGREKA